MSARTNKNARRSAPIKTSGRVLKGFNDGWATSSENNWSRSGRQHKLTLETVSDLESRTERSANAVAAATVTFPSVTNGSRGCHVAATGISRARAASPKFARELSRSQPAEDPTKERRWRRLLAARGARQAARERSARLGKAAADSPTRSRCAEGRRSL